jgi:(p)ppGpp synthase/HD superfamily hydrolase
MRKSPHSVPYIVHPVHVALMLSGLGEDDTVIQAGLLHDVVEDCEDWTLERLEDEFGTSVASLVAEVTEDKSRSWDERKQTAIDHVPHLSPGALVVKGCDKVHNLRNLVAELRDTDDRDAVWSRFTGGRDRTLAMSRGLVEALRLRIEGPLNHALRDVLEELEKVA